MLHGKTGANSKLNAMERAQAKQAKDEEEEFYEVEKILSKKKIGRRVLYLVKWEGYSVEEATWEPVSNLKNVKDLVQQFESEQAKKMILSELEKNNMTNMQNLNSQASTNISMNDTLKQPVPISHNSKGIKKASPKSGKIQYSPSRLQIQQEKLQDAPSDVEVIDDAEEDKEIAQLEKLQADLLQQQESINR